MTDNKIDLHPPSASERVLVTGATGAVGPVIVQALHDAGYCVRTLSLDSPTNDLFPDQIEILQGDVTQLSDVYSAMAGVNYVLHLAALLHINSPTADMEPQYEIVNVGGSRNIVEAAIAHHVNRVVLFSTIAVYGKYPGVIITEATPPLPTTLYAKTKLTAEGIVLGALNMEGVSIGTVLRMGAIYGARIKGNYWRLLLALARRRFIPIGNGTNRRTLIYEQDVANAALIAMRHPAARGQIFNVTDGEYHTLQQVIATICLALNRPVPRINIPVPLVYTLARLVDQIASMLGKEINLQTLIDKYTEDIAVDSRKIQENLGFTPKYDLLTGWQRVIIALRKVGYRI